jgi:hypothetical protein
MASLRRRMQAMKEMQTADEVSETEPDEQLFEVSFLH